MPGRIVELDVRPFHARGEEPFRAIMETVSSLGPEDVLVLVNSFEPVPLYGVMAGRGFRHRGEEVEPGVWRVTFWREPPEAAGAGGAPGPAPAAEGAEASGARPAAASGPAPAAGPEAAEGRPGSRVPGRVLELDNRGLSPPEPLVRVLDTLDRLEPGDRLVVRNDRRPLFLYPELAERGFRHHTEDLPDGSVRVVIWRD